MVSHECIPGFFKGGQSFGLNKSHTKRYGQRGQTAHDWAIGKSNFGRQETMLFNDPHDRVAERLNVVFLWSDQKSVKDKTAGGLADHGDFREIRTVPVADRDGRIEGPRFPRAIGFRVFGQRFSNATIVQLQ